MMMGESIQTLGGVHHFQLGYVVRDLAAAIAKFEQLGASLLDRIIDMRDGEGHPVIIRNLSHLQLGSREVELIEAREGYPSVYTDWPLPEDGIALHHLGYLADTDGQWDEASRLWSTLPVAMAIDLPRVRVRYYDTRETLGHYLELVQRRSLPG